MSNLLQDIRYTLRILLKSPGYTAVVVLVLGLGIGANTAVFSVVHAVLLRPLPYPQSDRLMVVRERRMAEYNEPVAYPDYVDWRNGQHSFTDLAMARRDSANIAFPAASGLPPERINSATISANFLSILGLHPELGRDLSAAEDTPGGPKAVLLSDALWRRRFGSDRTAVGQRILVNGVSREIVGVVPPEVGFPRMAEMFVPMGDLRVSPDLNSRGNHVSFSVLGRLKPGVTPIQAEQDLAAIAAELARRYPDSNAGEGVHVQSMLNAAVSDYSQSLYLLLGAVGCVLLIACANVANLQLARASTRQKELAVRAALGAKRWRLMRQMLTESAVIGLLGGALALLLALWATDAIVGLSPEGAPRFHEVHLDLAALGFTAVIALGTGLLVGIWPAWRISGLAGMATALHEGSSRGGTGSAVQQRTRATLVVAQVALAMGLLACAGLTLKSFWRLQNTPLGFRRDSLLMMAISLPETKYPEEKVMLFDTQLLARVRQLPGVASVAIGSGVPFSERGWSSDFHLTGTPPNVPGNEPEAQMSAVSPGYFQMMGIPLLQGRDFNGQDTVGQPKSVIIDESMARKYFPGQDPVGKHIDDSQTLEKNPPPLTVVGVVGRTLHDAPGSDPHLEPLVQMIFCTGQDVQSDVNLMVRVASGDPMRLLESIRQEVLALDPELPVAEAGTMDGKVAASLAPRRLTMVLLGTFAALALGLASIGLYGVMALTVTQRTREMGIRLALGAQRSAVMALVMRQGAALVGIGLLIGLVGALVSGRLLASYLYDVGSSDAATLGLVAAVLGVAAMLACWLPALRATKVDPMVALRSE